VFHGKVCLKVPPCQGRLSSPTSFRVCSFSADSCSESAFIPQKTIGRGNCQCSCVYYYLLLTRFVTCHRIFDTKSDISVSFGTQMHRPSFRHRCSNKEACGETGQPLRVHVSHFSTRTHSDFISNTNSWYNTQGHNSRKL
jgi:hypothetical protein